MTPAVSIVVPCFNGGTFLDQLLDSLRAQSFRNFEVVIVNDGSTDTLTREKLAALDPAIRVLHQENRGLPAARNAGIRAALAPLVLPLDCDDALAPSFLSETVAALAADAGAAFAFTHMKTRGVIQDVLPRRCNRFDQLFLNQLPYCLLMRRSAWEAVDGYDEAMREGYEDWEFNIRLLRAEYRGVEIAKPLFIYSVSAHGMLLGGSARKHGAIWARIRAMHRDLYRPRSLLALWRDHRSGARVRGPLALALLTGTLLPSRMFGTLFHYGLMTKHRMRAARHGGAEIVSGRFADHRD